MSRIFTLFILTGFFNAFAANDSELVMVPPTASFSSSTNNACIGQIVLLTDNSSDVPTSWNWSFSPTTVTFQNGTTASSQNPEVTFDAAGSYTVTLMATNGDGTGSASQTVEVISTSSLPFLEDFSSGVPPSGWGIYNPDGLEGWELVTAIGSDGNATEVARMDNYSYNAPGELDELITPSIDISTYTNPLLLFDVAYAAYNATSSERLYIEYSNDCGSTFQATSYDKTDPELPTVGYQFGGWAPSLASEWRTDTVDISAYATSGTIFKIIQENAWGNGLFIDNVRIISADPTVAGYTVDMTNLCTDTTFLFQDISTNGPTSWAWDFGPDATPANATTEGPHSVTYSSGGAKLVTLTVTNSNGSDTYSSTLNMTEAISNTAFSQTLTNYTASFTGSSSGDSPTYAWDFGDGNTSTQQNPTHTYAANGNYSVCLVATNSCGSDTSCQNVIIDCIFPVTDFTNGTTNYTANFTDATQNAVTSWLWDFGDGNTSTQQNPSHTYQMNGTYTVCLITTNACGSDSSCQNIIIFSLLLVSRIPGTTEQLTLLMSAQTPQTLGHGILEMEILRHNKTHLIPIQMKELILFV